ncbi:MAG: hypothetical protein ACF8GE_06680 [Phycisphaerales bacterium JB043]
MLNDVLTILIMCVSLLGVLGCFYVLALRLERDRALHTLVNKARNLQRQQELRLKALRDGVVYDDPLIAEVGSEDGYDVDIVDDDSLQQAA